jgi:chromosome segregation ATPase
MPRGITENDVWQAADALLLEGARPTIERVRLKIGRGSPNTVSPHLETWFRHLGARIKDPKSFSAPAHAPDPVAQAAQHFWEVAAASARAELKEEGDRIRADAATAVEAALADARAARVACVDADTRRQHTDNELAAARQRLDSMRQEHAAQTARLEAGKESAERELAAAAARAAELGKRSELLMQRLDAAVERADAADRRVAIELERERQARTKAEKRSDALERELTQLRSAHEAALGHTQQRLAEAMELEARAKSSLAVALTELAAVHAATAELRASLAESREQDKAAQQRLGSIEELLATMTRGRVAQDTVVPGPSDRRKPRAEPRAARKRVA